MDRWYFPENTSSFTWIRSICCPKCFVKECSTHCSGFDEDNVKTGCGSPYIWVTENETEGTLETPENTHLDLWKNTGPSRAKLNVTRRAVVSRVIRVQRRYAVRIRPMESVAWAHFGYIFDLFIKLYIICRYFFPHRIRLDDSFGQNVINFHKL